MSSHAQIYVLLTMSMLFTLFGAFCMFSLAFGFNNNQLDAAMVPFTLVGLLGLHMTTLTFRLAERIEHLESQSGNGNRAPSNAGAPVGVGRP